MLYSVFINFLKTLLFIFEYDWTVFGLFAANIENKFKNKFFNIDEQIIS